MCVWAKYFFSPSTIHKIKFPTYVYYTEYTKMCKNSIIKEHTHTHTSTCQQHTLIKILCDAVKLVILHFKWMSTRSNNSSNVTLILSFGQPIIRFKMLSDKYSIYTILWVPFWPLAQWLLVTTKEKKMCFVWWTH